VSTVGRIGETPVYYLGRNDIVIQRYLTFFCMVKIHTRDCFLGLVVHKKRLAAGITRPSWRAYREVTTLLLMH